MPRSALRHVQVDHCLPVAGIAETLVELARDAPSGVAAADRAVAAIEHRIACGTFGAEDWLALEERSLASGFNCPDCRSALYEIRDARLLRFRCRSGHAWSSLSLLAAQAEAHETQLSFLFGVAMEEAALARRLAAASEAGDDPEFAAGLRARLAFLQRQTQQLSEWLHGMDAAVGSTRP